MNMFWPVFTHY